MRTSVGAPFFLRLGARMRGPSGTQPGRLRRVLFSNITSSAAGQLPAIVAGIPSHPVEDLKVSDLYLEQTGGAASAMAVINPAEKESAYPASDMFGALPATGVFLRHARNVEMSNIEIATLSPDARPAFWLEDIDGADFFRLRIPKNVPAFDLRRVNNFRTFGSQFLKDVTLDTANKRII